MPWNLFSLETKPGKITAIILLVVFIFVRILLETIWRSLSEYYSYFFELFFIALTFFIYRKRITVWKKLRLKDWLIALLSLASGLVIYKLASPLGLIVPFDFKARETLFFLLIVAPLLEEALFRGALWETLKGFSSRGWFLIIGSTFLFSIGHLASFWFVPEEFKSFVLYQATYVIFLALVLGRQRLKTNSLSVPVVIHFVFNLGFYLGFYLSAR